MLLYLTFFFFLSCLIAILVQNTIVVTKKKYNHPSIGLETFYQIVLLLVLTAVVFIGNDFIGVSFYNIFNFIKGTSILQLVLITVTLLSLPSIFLAFNLQRLDTVEYFSLILCALFSMFFLISSASLVSMYVCVEMQTICFYVLAAYKKSSGFSSESGLKYFISSAVFSAIFLLGASTIYFCLGTINFIDLKSLTFFNIGRFDPFLCSVLNVGIFIVTAWLLFKLTCVPFHMWSPDVYEGAPLGTTIFLSGPAKLAIVYIFIKWSYSININSQSTQELLLFFSFLSAFVGTFLALFQERVKRLIIYSSIAQVGYICSSVFNYTIESLVATIVFLLIYIITSIVLWNVFVLFICFEENFDTSTNDFNILHVSKFSNIKIKNEPLAFSITFILFSIGGLPPLVGFLGKFAALSSLIESTQFWLALMLVVVSCISIFYYIRVVKTAYFETQHSFDKVISLKFMTRNNPYVAYIFICNIVLLAFIFLGVIFPETAYLLAKLIVLGFA